MQLRIFTLQRELKMFLTAYGITHKKCINLTKFLAQFSKKILTLNFLNFTKLIPWQPNEDVNPISIELFSARW